MPLDGMLKTIPVQPGASCAIDAVCFREWHFLIGGVIRIGLIFVPDGIV